MLLRHRHRRICTACSKVPLSTLIGPGPLGESQWGFIAPVVCLSKWTPLVARSATVPTKEFGFANLVAAHFEAQNNEYESIWKWRTRYLPSLGGLGVGIGEGNRGVECGRGGECVAAKEVEQETDCDAEDAREIEIKQPIYKSLVQPGKFIMVVYTVAKWGLAMPDMR